MRVKMEIIINTDAVFIKKAKVILQNGWSRWMKSEILKKIVIDSVTRQIHNVKVHEYMYI